MTEEEIHSRFAELENRVTGLEMTLAEISFYAHDASAGTFEKDVLASRLIALAKQVPQIFRDPTIAEQIAFPMNRLAQALKTAGRIDEDDNTIHGMPL